ncbi:hypothetical protein ACJ72_03287 [Emergomyces africanus]|uniref:Uncharacterized protein n=1 Tax=Emergomyces africanus TaxID=1955775 RepID=A0A1B7P031_9EURO|nr:hypothetical protein ACJ72_03287 [Emergomyces africanus]
MFGKSGKSGTVPSSKSSANPSSAPDPVKERADAIKEAQGHALSHLPLNTLYIVLYIRSDPPRENDFHWGFYVHTHPFGGSKYHIRNLGSGWIPDHGPTGGVFKSNFLCVLVQIADVPEAKTPQLDQIMRSLDPSINAIPGISCRVWLFTVLQNLVHHGIVRCTDLAALQQECMGIGNQNMADAAVNRQPRPVTRSRLCL